MSITLSDSFHLFHLGEVQRKVFLSAICVWLCAEQTERTRPRG